MGKKEQVPALAMFVQGSLWVWSATSRGRPPDGGLALAVFHMVPRVPAAPNLFVHPPADLRNVLLPPSSRPARLLRVVSVFLESILLFCSVCRPRALADGRLRLRVGLLSHRILTIVEKFSSISDHPFYLLANTPLADFCPSTV